MSRVLGRVGDLEVTQENLNTLLPGEWLDSVVLDAFFKLKVGERKDVYLVSAENDFPDFKRVVSTHFSLIPLYRNDHWTLAFVDSKKKVIRYLNSQLHPLHLDEIIPYFSSNLPDFSFHITSAPQQCTQDDCGVFVCSFGESLLEASSPSLDCLLVSEKRREIRRIILGGLKEVEERKERKQVSKRKETRSKKGGTGSSGKSSIKKEENLFLRYEMSDWNHFVKANAGKGWTMSQMSEMYHAQGGMTNGAGGKKKSSYRSKSKSPGRKAKSPRKSKSPGRKSASPGRKKSSPKRKSSPGRKGAGIVGGVLGAGAGALVGSVAGPVGTIAGGIAGAFAGHTLEEQERARRYGYAYPYASGTAWYP